jgi:hypothetical protein
LFRLGRSLALPLIFASMFSRAALAFSRLSFTIPVGPLGQCRSAGVVVLLVHARVLAVLAGFVAAFLSPAANLAADRLILRNLDFVLDRTVVEMDEDGVRLDAALAGGSDRLTWDQIERGTVALDQPRFNQLLGELGLPLYRVRQRLKTGDYDALAEPAEAVYPRFANRRSQSAFMVAQALAWSRLAGGRREAAVEPLLQTCELLRGGSVQVANLPGDRRPLLDPVTSLTSELTPVWFDAAAAKETLPSVQQAIRTMTQPRPAGVYIYYATLALVAGEPAEADRVLDSLRGDDPLLSQWRAIILAQREVQAGTPGTAVAALQAIRSELTSHSRPAALYWLGMAQVASSDEETIKDGLLDLLSLPAEEPRDRELAAAGLYQAALTLDKLKDDRGAAALRQELARQYGGSWHAKQMATAGK